jgi:hypothetical protein
LGGAASRRFALTGPTGHGSVSLIYNPLLDPHASGMLAQFFATGQSCA